MSSAGPSRFSARLRHPVIREWLVILLSLWLLALLAVRGEWFWRVDQTLYDAAVSLFERPPAPDIAIIGIDEQSLKQIGRWPWKRNIHATLLNRLTDAGAEVVVLDVILSERDRTDPHGDQVLADAIRRNGKTVLPITMDAVEGVTTGEALPAPEFAAGAASLSHVSLELDPDGVLRTSYLQSGIGAARHDVSPLAALRIAEPAAWRNASTLPGEANPRKPLNSRSWVRDHWYHIPFAGPPGHFKAFSYVDVLRGDVPDAALKNRIVMVGVTATGMTDEYPTPVSGGTRAMSGIEVQANILQGLRDGIDIRLASMTATIVLVAITVAMLMFSYLWLTPRVALAITAAGCLAVLTASALLFRYQAIWLSPVVPFLTLLLAYPLWSWRKLEATQRYFDAELARLEQEPSIVPQEIAQSISPRASLKSFIPDVIENRIAAVQSTALRLRNLNRFVADSLESLPAAALITDAEGRIMLANSSADRLFHSRRRTALGERPADRALEGRDLFELMQVFRHDSPRTWRDIWMDVHEETSARSLEAKGPGDREYLVQIAPSFSARGTQTGSILILTDISPLRESERRRDEALRFLSHDMRSPQASILTLLEMYKEDPEAMPTAKLTDRVGRYARRTLNLADDFLQLAKAERVTAKDFEPMDLVEILRDASEEAWSIATAKKIRVELDVELAEEEAWLQGDRDLLTRAFTNLLSNAVKYSPPETRILCGLVADAAQWRVTFADQGYGIAAGDMPKLFTRFTRLKHDAQPEEGGIGLGLVFVKTVVERHNGTISVDSRVAAFEGDERGTTFTLVFDAISAPD
ncbi:MAG: CHASE2 domain-containing protein [Betaproteobacteria bacterium]